MPDSKLLNLHLATAIGSLSCVYARQPKEHTRVARLCGQIIKILYTKVNVQLPMIDDFIMLKAHKILPEIEDKCNQAVERTGKSADVILLALVCFCVDELPNNRKMNDALFKLLECFEKQEVFEISTVETVEDIWNYLVEAIYAEKGE